MAFDMAQLHADSPLSPILLNPRSAPEAWNVIRLATRNVDLLLAENRLREIPMQMAYCSPSLRLLPQTLDQTEAETEVEKQIKRAFISFQAMIDAAQQSNPVGVQFALSSFRQILATVAEHFDSRAVNAEIFVCPMHPDVLSEVAETPCSKCGMHLITRRIPDSSIYTKPGEPTIHLIAKAGALVEAGKSIDVKVQLCTTDNKPVLPQDLLIMHTQAIHLLIEEPGLSDYHHEHPVPTENPGEYSFSFTPKRTSPYRIWADIVPAATGTHELPFVDLSSAGKPAPIESKTDCFTSTAGNYQFVLSSRSATQFAANAGEVRNIAIKIADRNGQPVTTLQPVMNAFAHLVGFYDDYRTVLHMHPGGGDIVDAQSRGGPSLDFTFFAPRAGFVRLYCQVNIAGEMLFAPFNINVEP